MLWFLFLLTFSYQAIAFINKPNVVILYVEHLNEVGTILEMIATNQLPPSSLPNIYQLKNDSVSFHNFFGELSTTSNFAALFTGKPAVDLGIIRGKLLPFTMFPSLASSGGLKLEEITLAEKLQNCGYRTWFSGYWKLGLGETGDHYPTKHGFDTWMGIAHPHTEWCHRKNSNRSSSTENWINPYSNLMYRTSFFLAIVFILLTSLIWFKFITWKLFLNLLIYTLSSSLAFFILLHLFIIQRSASCVLYYHDSIYQQPYEMKNLTLHFTQHSSKLINIVSGTYPFFMVLNYMKLTPPLFHSNYFRTKSTDTWHSSLLELDWSIGKIVSTLKENQVYDDTIIFLTGSNTCSSLVTELKNTKAFERNKENEFFEKTVTNEKLWDRCIKSTLLIKDVNVDSTAIKDVVAVTDVFPTILHMTSCQPHNQDLVNLAKLYRKNKFKQAIVNHNIDKFFNKFHLPSEINKSLSQSELDLSKSSKIGFGEELPPLNKPVQIILESEDADSIVEVVEPIFENDELKSDVLTNFKTFAESRVLFHYSNIEKPVMITYKEQYQLVYAYIDANGSPVKLSSPWLIDRKNTDNNTIDFTLLESIYQNITKELSIHLTERINKNPWSSQFEMPVYPWLLPCANFPLCEKLTFYDDFSDILQSDNST